MSGDSPEPRPPRGAIRLTNGKRAVTKKPAPKKDQAKTRRRKDGGKNETPYKQKAAAAKKQMRHPPVKKETNAGIKKRPRRIRHTGRSESEETLLDAGKKKAAAKRGTVHRTAKDSRDSADYTEEEREFKKMQERRLGGHSEKKTKTRRRSKSHRHSKASRRSTSERREKKERKKRRSASQSSAVFVKRKKRSAAILNRGRSVSVPVAPVSVAASLAPVHAKKRSRHFIMDPATAQKYVAAVTRFVIQPSLEVLEEIERLLDSSQREIFYRDVLQNVMHGWLPSGMKASDFQLTIRSALEEMKRNKGAMSSRFVGQQQQPQQQQMASSSFASGPVGQQTLTTAVGGGGVPWKFAR